MREQAHRGSSPKRCFTFLITSARCGGNTELLTRAAAEALPRHYEQLWLRLSELPLLPFEDIRHSVGVYPQPTGNERILFDATLGATDLVFSAPLYWYSVPTSAKHYLDYWSAWLRVPGADFRQRMVGKTLWGICVLSEEDQGRAGPLINMLANTADYMKMEFGGVLLGYGSRPGDVMGDTEAMTRARTFFAAGADKQKSEIESKPEGEN